MASERDDVEALADELFGKIQTAQGMSYISDGEHFETKAQFFERLRGRLSWQREGVKIIAAFLRKHGELNAKETP